MKIVVLGGTGLIGTKLVDLLRARGHSVVAASPRSGVNAVTGEGLAAALRGAAVVVDVTNSPSFEEKAVMEFFESSGRSLAAEDVALAMADAALATPVNGAIEIAGPERMPMSEAVSRYFAAIKDPREVVGGPGTPYFGLIVEEGSLVPAAGARLGAIRLDSWLAQQRKVA